MELAGSQLRVLAVGRPNARVAPGGGEVQMASTVAALGRLGVAARMGRVDGNALQWADRLHLFGSCPEHLPLVEAARRRGVPTVLSTIAWFDWADYWRGGTSPVGRAAAVARFAARAVCPRLPSWRRRLYHAVDLLLPNSTAEARQLIRHFGVSPERIRVVPNGADPRFAACDAGPFVERFGLRDFVLCPGRIEPRKNQLGLIRALRGSGVPLVILGRVVPGHESYLERCRREAGEDVRFLDRFEHDDPMLGAAYAACGCLALTSWFETPGLVALEAAMSGTPLVLPEGGAAAEYFGPYARYVWPNDYRGIRRAALHALDAGRSRELAEHVRENFSWDAAARATAEAYEAATEWRQRVPRVSPLFSSRGCREKRLFPSPGVYTWGRENENSPFHFPFIPFRGRKEIVQRPLSPAYALASPKGDFEEKERSREGSRSAGVNAWATEKERYRYVRRRWHVMFAVVDFVGGLVFRLAKGDSPVFRSARYWLARLLGRKTGQSPVETEPTPADDPRSILVIQLDHLGDAILSTAMLSALRRRYPLSSIEVLAGEWNRDVFAAMDAVDRVHVSRLNRFSRSRRFGWPAAVFWWGWRLRRRRFDLGIDVRGEFPLALILWLCGARRRLGWSAGGGGFLLTDSPEYVPNRPEIESRGALLAELGVSIDRAEDLWPEFRCPTAARHAVRRRLNREGPRGPFVAVHVSTGTAAKQWPVEHWRTLVGRLVVEHGLDVVLVGGRADRAVATTILEEKIWPGVHDWTGRTNVVELAALLAQAAVVVGADSGPVHLAAAVGRPVVALFSGTNRPEQWQPRGRRVTVLRHAVACSPCHREHCPREDHPCMRRLRPEEVLAAVLAAMPAGGESYREGARGSCREGAKGAKGEDERVAFVEE